MSKIWDQKPCIPWWTLKHLLALFIQEGGGKNELANTSYMMEQEHIRVLLTFIFVLSFRIFYSLCVQNILAQ
jgi:hypothetical protein